jgi:hypothetical protein
MICPEFRLAHFYYLYKQLLGRVPPALIPVYRRQIGHINQRV